MRSPTIANDNSGRIIPFPVARQNAVRREAEAVTLRQGVEADEYWRRMISTMRMQLVGFGMSEDAIEAELRAFSESIFSSIAERCA